LKATPFDIPDVEFTHYGSDCTFDYFIKKYKLKDPVLQTFSTIVRGADTDRHDLHSKFPDYGPSQRASLTTIKMTMNC